MKGINMSKKKKLPEVCSPDWWDTHLVIDGVDKDTAEKIKDRLKDKMKEELTDTKK